MTSISSKKKLLPPPDPSEFIDFGGMAFCSNDSDDREEGEKGLGSRKREMTLIRPALGLAFVFFLGQVSSAPAEKLSAFMPTNPVFLARKHEQKLSRFALMPRRVPVAMDTLPSSDLQVEWKTPSAAGGFGAVYFGKLVNGEEVVVKVSYEDEFSERLLSNELHFNQKLQSAIPSYHGRRWASFLGACSVPNVPDAAINISSKRGLVFRREQGLSLDHYINSQRQFEQALSLPPSSSSSPLRIQLFSKVHRAGIVHRDVKPDNILLVPGDRDCPLKLIDFGSACDLGAAVRRGLGDDTVDPLYAPPELRVDLKSPHGMDMFCAACTALRVLLPSLAADPQRLKAFQEEMAAGADYDLEAWCRRRAGRGEGAEAEEARALLLPRNLWILDLLAPMLRRTPSARPAPQQVLRRMGPVWAARVDSMEILAPQGSPLVGSVGERLLREVRYNPWAALGVVAQAAGLLTHLLAQRLLPRLSSALSEGTRKLLRSVTQALRFA